ncbi:branched-subunit amino acid transport protein AzlD [Kribbella amoyensis]|uniref:Branched-subunit amino acid transport protein AzlD n=1 Tax=Kribbella amoyensis TaxID=996641 RepID=A0A561BVD8_9ACTN|nr:AzlD domain-containing protein [Kribbella amoyensis]TWD82781.1 branched-subunit amino acid transport protein AzlD [Kribbella amoyensis]
MIPAVVSMVLLAGVCWVFRIAFVTLLPAERLPQTLRSALEHLAPAVLASMIAVEILGFFRHTSSGDAVEVAAAIVIIAAVARLTRSLWLVSVVGLGLVAVLDLILA